MRRFSGAAGGKRDFISIHAPVKGATHKKRLMHLVGEAIVLWAQKEKVGIIDSTPIEASRYDRYALFHPHYQVKMDVTI